jgi:transposase
MTTRVVSFPQKQQAGESGMMTGDTGGMIRALDRQGWAQREIARELDLDPKTVRRALQQATRPLSRRRKTAATLLAGHEAFLRHRALEVDSNARRLLEELRARGYQGGDDLVKLFLRPPRAERDRLVEATLRFATAPGHQAQVDWGPTWAQLGDTRLRGQLFVMVLGYSRRVYAEFTPEETVASLIPCHEHAFEWFGGLTEEILYDNPKTVVLKRDWAGRVIAWHPQFGAVARYYGFTPRRCRPDRAQTKGKVESGIKDVKRRFVKGRLFPVREAMHPRVQEWLVSVADQRIHGTTFRKPAQLFPQESLRSHAGKPPYQLTTPIVRVVARDGLVTVDTNRYSGPSAYVGKMVQVHTGVGHPLQISYRGELIATHRPLVGTHQVQMEPRHYQGLWPRRQPPATPAAGTASEGLSLWPIPQGGVQGRDLAVYEALVSSPPHGPGGCPGTSPHEPHPRASAPAPAVQRA